VTRNKKTRLRMNSFLRRRTMKKMMKRKEANSLNRRKLWRKKKTGKSN
jgi:hypothetical protein